MGYASYVLPDGRDAGYAITAKCDVKDCLAKIDRGLGYLCGYMPDGHRPDDQWGCGHYFCGAHSHDHDCPRPQCDAWSADRRLACAYVAGHEDAHYDPHLRESFTE